MIHQPPLLRIKIEIWIEKKMKVSFKLLTAIVQWSLISRWDVDILSLIKMLIIKVYYSRLILFVFEILCQKHLSCYCVFRANWEYDTMYSFHIYDGVLMTNIFCICDMFSPNTFTRTHWKLWGIKSRTENWAHRICWVINCCPH